MKLRKKAQLRLRKSSSQLHADRRDGGRLTAPTTAATVPFVPVAVGVWACVGLAATAGAGCVVTAASVLAVMHMTRSAPYEIRGSVPSASSRLDWD